ncbi:MAG: ATP-dependent helicase, partial [Methanomassiliicoccales archaeon]|nr:ATP-dependent helicase [Methanomassiliicoccales archaeon]
MERVRRAYSKNEVMSLMEPLVAEWFNSKFSDLTEPQAFAIPIIHNRENVLVSSPTGSGKTLTAFLSIINELLKYARDGKLEDRVYAVYVSPLKALANDINRNLREPLSEMKALAESKGITFPDIRVGVRSGDTSQAERQKMLRKPPHIFITTPESLALVLAAPKFKERFTKVEWTIVDEVHEICDSKRGVFLSLTLERLQEYCSRPFVRVGLSATLAPIDEIAAFLVGFRNGKQREVEIVEVKSPKSLDLEVLCPTEDMTALPYEIVNSKMYDMLADMVRKHTTTLVFTNTRSGTESVVYKLKERGLDSIEAHHGSLSKETRLNVEERLKKSELKCVVSSTSLELGIDIGSIDLVCQIGSPKSVAKGLQRVGRSGHGYLKTSKGRMIVFDNDDLVECAVLCRAAHRNKIDRVSIPQNCLDVLAQSIVGMSIESRWKVEDALELVRRSYCYRNLPEDLYLDVLRYLGSKDAFEGVYSKIWYDEEEGTFGRKRGARMIYFLNLGTIPEEANYKVYAERGAMIGDLSEKFVERLSPRDIFVLGGRTYEFVRSRGMSVYVKTASGKKPTVPSWTGEMLPRSFDLSLEVARFRGEMAERLTGDEKATLKWLCDDFDIDEGSARSILSYFEEQQSTCGTVPTDKNLVIEGYVDMTGNHNVIFHFPFGRRVNDALSRAYAFQLTQQLGSNVSVSVTDDAFMLSVPRSVDFKGLGGLVSSSDLGTLLRRALKDSEIFKQRFRHTAARSFMILRNYKGREVSVNRQQVRSSYLLDSLRSVERVPVVEETYREIMEEVMDLPNAAKVLKMIEGGEVTIQFVDFSSIPSPFSHNVVLAGISDIVLMEDRSSLLRELHRRILSKVMASDLSEFEFEEQKVTAYFRKKIGRIEVKEDILRVLRLIGPMHIFRERARSLYPYSSRDKREIDGWAEELLAEGRIASAYSDDYYFVASEDLSTYAALFRKERTLGDLDHSVLDLLGGEKSSKDIADSLGVSTERIARSLHSLESASLVGRVAHREGRWYFKRTKVEDRERESSLRKAICKFLEGSAPSTLDEISFALGLSDAEVSDSLEALVREGMVAEGLFLVSEHKQYMLRRDHLRLRSQNSEAYDLRTVELYRRSKTRGPFASIEGCIRFLGSVGDPLDLTHRVKDFSIDDWERLRRSGKVLLGRFLRGRVRYVLAEDAPMYVSAYR